MAYDYLSAILDVGTKENVAKALDIWDDYVETMNDEIEKNETLRRTAVIKDLNYLDDRHSDL